MHRVWHRYRLRDERAKEFAQSYTRYKECERASKKHAVNSGQIAKVSGYPRSSYPLATLALPTL